MYFDSISHVHEKLSCLEHKAMTKEHPLVTERKSSDSIEKVCLNPTCKRMTTAAGAQPGRKLNSAEGPQPAGQVCEPRWQRGQFNQGSPQIPLGQVPGSYLQTTGDGPTLPNMETGQISPSTNFTLFKQITSGQRKPRESTVLKINSSIPTDQGRELSEAHLTCMVSFQVGPVGGRMSPFHLWRGLLDRHAFLLWSITKSLVFVQSYMCDRQILVRKSPWKDAHLESTVPC